MSCPVGGVGRGKSNKIKIVSSYKFQRDFVQCTIYLSEPQEDLTEYPKQNWIIAADPFFFFYFENGRKKVAEKGSVFLALPL